MRRYCELCNININHKRKGARYCCRPHKEKHYRHLNREKYKKLKSQWQKQNYEKLKRLRILKHKKEQEKLGITRHGIRTYTLRHLNELRAMKPEMCYKCGNKEDLEVHHKKYTKNPKDWEFICKLCHKRLHNPNSMV